MVEQTRESASGATFSVPGLWRMSYEYWLQDAKQEALCFNLSTIFFLSNMEVIDFWSVMIVKCLPFKKCDHFLMAFTMVVASFSTAG